jgi:hypothetical protein
MDPPPALPPQPLSRDQRNRDPRFDSDASVNRLPQLLPPTNPRQKSRAATGSCQCGHDH